MRELQMPVESPQTTKSDRLWLDEYAKRGLMRNVYSTSSMAFTWTLVAKLTQMLMDKSRGKPFVYHRTPLH